ncbi:hypothetical protein [Aneurinibacillus tyrosinisolvens]|uniref:hypothetical protein n=1 Tax=Aneurinibacillus tyrosinisolvens TaxID=1443435 RepID=UPI00063FBDAA|nr:hypothetical protein [Aneurinibacillus tyrosinisolvens]
MENLDEFSRFVLIELEKRTGIKESEISILDSASVDLMENSFSVEFTIRNDDDIYTFWHAYGEELGNLTKKVMNDASKEEILVKYWGDWSIYGFDDDEDEQK